MPNFATWLVPVVVAACASGQGGGLPSGDHLHSLAVTVVGDLLLGLHGGLYRSDDGTAWELVGLDGQDAMVIAAAGPDPLFVAGHEVLARSDDGGETFQELRPADLPGLDIHAFAQAPADGRVIFAFVVGYGLFSSRDAGDTWEQRAPLGVVPPDTFGLAVVGSGTDTLVLVGPDNGILRSEDGGGSFARVMEVPAWAVTVDPSEPSRLWTLTSQGLMESGDAGVSWVPASSLEGVEGQPVALAVGKGGLWLASESPRVLYRSDDRGRSWEAVGRR